MTPTPTTTVTLAVPLTLNGTAVSELILRRPTGGDLRGLSLRSVLRMETDPVFTLVPRICTNHAVTESDLEKADPFDLSELAAVLWGFFAQSPKSEATTS